MIGATRQIKEAGHEECGFPIPLCRRKALLHNSICCTLVPIIPNSSVVCNRARWFSNWQKGLCVCKYMRCGIIPAPLCGVSARINRRHFQKDRKKPPLTGWFFSVHLVELQSHCALFVRGVISVQNALGSGLVNRLDRDLVCALGLGAIAISGSGLKLFQGGFHGGSLSLRALRTRATSTRFLADLIFGKPNTSSNGSYGMDFFNLPTQKCILSWFDKKCKEFFLFSLIFLHISISPGKNRREVQDLVGFGRERHNLCE